MTQILKQSLLAGFIVLLTTMWKPALGQNPNILWGDVQDITKRGGDLSIVHSDETGVYMIEVHAKANIRPYGIKITESKIKYDFMKFDKNFKLLYVQELSALLEEYEYDGMYMLGKNMYVFARKYDKDAFTHSIIAAKVNTATGKLDGKFNEIVTLATSGKYERMNYDVAQATDEQSWVVKIELTDGKISTFYTARVDATLKKLKPKQFFLPDEETYELKEVENLGVNKILCIGDKYDLVDVGKKKPVRRKTGIAVDIFGDNGRKLKSLPPVISGKFIMEAQLLSANKHWYLVGNYCNTAKVDEIHGFFRAGIDADKGTFTQAAITPVSQGLMGTKYQELLEMEKTKKEKRKDDDHEDDGLNSNYKILKVIENKDGGITLVAEIFWVEKTEGSTQYYNSQGMATRTRSYSAVKETYAEIIVLKTKADGVMEWGSVLPKKQENIMNWSDSHSPTGIHFFVVPSVPKLMDMYHSVGLYVYENNLFMMFNDAAENVQVLKPGDKVKTLEQRKNALGFIVKCNLETGAFSRYMVPKDKDDPAMLPRMGFPMDNTYIIPAISVSNLGRTKGDLRLGRLSL